MALRIDDTGFAGIRLTQDTEAFCYGIDAVLLASFAARGGHRTYIDLGTNNGIIPLLLSAMTEAEALTGVELQEPAAALAAHNAAANHLEHRVRILQSDILELRDKLPPGSFEAVVTNPPYVRRGAGLPNDAAPRTAARHETTAVLDDFVQCASYLLGERGAFYMIHRPDRLADILWGCRNAALEPKVMRFVSPRPMEAPNLVLLECRKRGGRELKVLPPLAVYREEGGYTDEVLAIYGREREPSRAGRHTEPAV